MLEFTVSIDHSVELVQMEGEHRRTHWRALWHTKLTWSFYMRMECIVGEFLECLHVPLLPDRAYKLQENLATPFLPKCCEWLWGTMNNNRCSVQGCVAWLRRWMGNIFMLPPRHQVTCTKRTAVKIYIVCATDQLCISLWGKTSMFRAVLFRKKDN